MILLLHLCLLSCREKPAGLPEGAFLLHSVHTGDDYQIEVKKPAGFSEDKPYDLVFLADGTLGLGEYVLGKNPSWSATVPANCVIVAIGHRGNWEAKRRRDFIPSATANPSDSSFGHADRFYAFLKEELMPGVSRQFPQARSRVFVGHSFSGLFCLYAALRNEGLFDDYYAISPSVWANDGVLLQMQEQFFQSHPDWNAHIQLYAGGLEVFNKVLSSTRKFYGNAQKQNPVHLRMNLDVIGNANHFSIRKPAIDRILDSLAH